ncbi:MAG: trimethylamine methyltransferase family protein [Candidatus Omnitrophica bacterium]|nr:trimethylamine methyltransferase family protein [Candidatus Omnitrophota bacterium]
MGKWRYFEMLDKNELNLLHNTMLKILNEVGFFVDNEEILKKLEEFGGKVNYDKKRVYFPPEFIENFIEDSEKINWSKLKPEITYQVSLYHGWYLDPFDNEYKVLDTEIFLKYFKIAQNLSLPFGGIYATPLPEIPEKFFLPYYHYLCFKFLDKGCCSINNIKWAELILKICEIYAEEKNLNLQDVISKSLLHIHFVSPLRFTKEEAEIFLYFAKRNLKIIIGVMDVIGSTTPVTISGAVSMHLSQVIFSNIIYRAFFGDKNLTISCEISPLDMKTTYQLYGRPEKEISNIIMAQIARKYKASFWAHTGHCDAKIPSPESGIQKIINSLPSLFSSKKANICCGLLSIDEVYSPIQMVIDKEIVEILKRFAKEEIIDEEKIGFDIIKEVIERNESFIASEHTVKYFKDQLWEPKIFTRDMFFNWKKIGMKKDIDIAKEIVSEALNGKKILPKISEKTEDKIIDIIYKFTGYRIKKVEPL